MQDRIVGPLTLYQFLYLLAGGMVFYATFKSGVIISFILLGIPAAMLALAFAFIKINEQPFLHFFTSFIFFTLHPKKRIWHHGNGSTTISLTENKNTQDKKVTVKHISRAEISQMAQSLDGRQS